MLTLPFRKPRPEVWPEDNHRVTAARLRAMLAGRPDPVRLDMKDAWWDGVLTAGMVFAGVLVVLLLGIYMWLEHLGRV